MSLPPTYVAGFHDEAAVKKMKYRKMDGPGWEVSIVSLGTSSLGSVFHDTVDTESHAVVRTAVREGINLIDTAPWYGHGKSETVLGQALQGIPRQAYYLTTKVGRYMPQPMEMFDFRAERVIASVDESLQRLGVAYIDSIQVHDPEFAPNLDIICHETLPALHKLKETGKVKNIGITGYPLEAHKYMLEHSAVPVDTALTYCHYSMNDTTLLDFVPFYKSKNVGVINASPISMGILSNRGPPKWHPATPEIKAVCQEAATICAAAGVELGKLGLHFSLAQEAIPTTLVSTASLARLKENVEAVSMPLTAQEAALSEQLMAQCFSKLKGRETWEDLEVGKYWHNIGKAYVLKHVYEH